MLYKARLRTVDKDGKEKTNTFTELSSRIRDDALEEFKGIENAVEFIEKNEHPPPEVKAVLKALQSTDWERMTEEEAAESIISALNEVRENSKRYVVMANLQWPDCPDFHLYAAGPFNTERQAQAVGERFANDPATHRGAGRWRIVPILAPQVGSARIAWSKVKPEPAQPCCSLHHGWLKDELDRWTWINMDENVEHWKEKGGW